MTASAGPGDRSPWVPPRTPPGAPASGRRRPTSGTAWNTGGLNRRGDDDEPDDGDDLVAYHRADADAEGAEQGSDGQVAPQHVGDAAGAQH